MPVSPVAERQVSIEDQYSLLMPPPEGFTADDLDRLPDLPPHTELIDGSLVLVSPQRNFHTVVLSVLDTRLFEQVPDRLRVRREMALKLGQRQRPEPDLILVQAQAIGGTKQTWFSPESVELVVEVVSSESELRDRGRKPQLYAEAGVPNFWLIEEDRGEAVVYVHELAPTGGYTRPTVHRQRLKTGQPFDIDIDLTEIQRR